MRGALKDALMQLGELLPAGSVIQLHFSWVDKTGLSIVLDTMSAIAPQLPHVTIYPPSTCEVQDGAGMVYGYKRASVEYKFEEITGISGIPEPWVLPWSWESIRKLPDYEPFVGLSMSGWGGLFRLDELLLCPLPCQQHCEITGSMAVDIRVPVWRRTPLHSLSVMCSGCLCGHVLCYSLRNTLHASLLCTCVRHAYACTPCICVYAMQSHVCRSSYMCSVCHMGHVLADDKTRKCLQCVTVLCCPSQHFAVVSAWAAPMFQCVHYAGNCVHPSCMCHRHVVLDHEPPFVPFLPRHVCSTPRNSCQGFGRASSTSHLSSRTPLHSSS